MTKKIINWTFGSFLRTLGRIFAYLSIGFLLAIISSKLGFNFGFIKVDALSLSNWSETLPNLPRTQIYDCNTSNICTTKNMSVEGITTDNGTRDFASLEGTVTIAKGGIAIQTNSNILKPGYLYLTNYYVCFNKNVDSAIPEIYNTNYSTPGKKNTTYNNASFMSLSGSPGNGNHVFNTCKQYSGLYVPSTENNWTTLRLTSDSTISNLYVAVIGYENKELGIYSDTIKKIVEDSNNNVVDAVDKVTEETKKTNDNIMNSDTTDANNSANSFFEDFNSGETGSLMNLVKLPLKFLNSLNSTCKPINLNTGYLGTISLPCLSSTLYNNKGIESIINIISLVLNGTIMYSCIRRIIECVQRLKNPADDEIEVYDL